MRHSRSGHYHGAMTVTNPLDHPLDPGTDSEESAAPDWTDGVLATFLDSRPDTRHALQRRVQEYPEYRAWFRMFAGDLLAVLEG
jgi:hypothetical protein